MGKIHTLGHGGTYGILFRNHSQTFTLNASFTLNLRNMHLAHCSHTAEHTVTKGKGDDEEEVKLVMPIKAKSDALVVLRQAATSGNSGYSYSYSYSTSLEAEFGEEEFRAHLKKEGKRDENKDQMGGYIKYSGLV